MRRRDALSIIGATAATTTLAGVTLACDSPFERMEGGPPDANWRLQFADDFEGDAIDGTNWSTGFGWGMATNNSPTLVSQENVSIEDSALKLAGTREDGNVYSGVVNSKGKVSVEPGSYVETKVRFARRTGFLNAFWMKPISEAWPPELDVVELFQSEDAKHTPEHSWHHIHYSESTEPGDESTYRSVGTSYMPGGDLTDSYHVYGVDWQADRVVHYVDGTAIREWTDDQLLTALERGAPYYMMFSIHIDKVGTTDRSEPWGETMDIDWVRVWEDRESS